MKDFQSSLFFEGGRGKREGVSQEEGERSFV